MLFLISDLLFVLLSDREIVVTNPLIKMCDESIAYPLKIIFETALKCGIYPDKRKKANVVPVHKKESKNILKNYRPISLLPVCGKIFEKCICNSLYSSLESNNILSKSQSGFRKGDSSISHWQ